MDEPNYQGPGRYMHYKGGEYEVYGLALHESELYRLVIYEPITPGSKLEGTPIKFWARPESDFNDKIHKGDSVVARFLKMGESSS